MISLDIYFQGISSCISLTCTSPCDRRHCPCRRSWLLIPWHHRRGEARGAASKPSTVQFTRIQCYDYGWMNLFIGWRGGGRVLCAGQSVHCRGGWVHPRNPRKSIKTLWVSSKLSLTCRTWRGVPPWCAWPRAHWWYGGFGGPMCKPEGSLLPVAGSQSPHEGT